MTTSPQIPSPAAILALRDGALEQMRFIRSYMLGLIDAVPDELWGTFPNGMQSHFAWQVGHLAVAQYGLMLFRQRGRAEGDMELMPSWLRKKYGKESVPSLDEVPSKSELLGLLSRINEESLQLAQSLSAETLAEPTEMPYAAYPIKLGALMFCPLHESIHAGQIGVLRRLHGLNPVR